mmetsp:Transcript_16974/g.40351  ORF Transcript_16974/g.40351 Transcript_16974/m.40351 type:complete len:356 (-) Transcript_16974:661-1728(-)
MHSAQKGVAGQGVGGGGRWPGCVLLALALRGGGGRAPRDTTTALPTLRAAISLRPAAPRRGTVECGQAAATGYAPRVRLLARRYCRIAPRARRRRRGGPGRVAVAAARDCRRAGRPPAALVRLRAGARLRPLGGGARVPLAGAGTAGLGGGLGAELDAGQCDGGECTGRALCERGAAIGRQVLPFLCYVCFCFSSFSFYFVSCIFLFTLAFSPSLFYPSFYICFCFCFFCSYYDLSSPINILVLNSHQQQQRAARGAEGHLLRRTLAVPGRAAERQRRAAVRAPVRAQRPAAPRLPPLHRAHVRARRLEARPRLRSRAWRRRQRPSAGARRTEAALHVGPRLPLAAARCREWAGQ